MLLTGVLTVSDSCFAGRKYDVSGESLQDLIASSLSPCHVTRGLVPDERELISSQLKRWCDQEKLDLIITTGGTGLAPRDVTPEATRPLLDRELPHLSTLMLVEGLKHTQFAALSRQVCGNRGRTLLLNFPGSNKAVKECFSAVQPLLKHAINLLKDELAEVDKCHSNAPAMKPEDLEFRRFPMLTVEECLKHIREQSSPLRVQKVPLHSALNKTLSSSVDARFDIPAFPASVKDGYALRYCDVTLTREVVSDCLAGVKSDVELGENQASYITTGGYLPRGSDSVVMVENTTLVEEDGKKKVNISVLPKKGTDVREPGSDMKKGEPIMEAGSPIGPLDMGILAAAGVGEVEVYASPHVGVFSTGDEIQDIRDLPQISEGDVIDSNRITLLSLLRNDGYSSQDFGIVRDEPDKIRQALLKSLSLCDVIVSTGGMSMGNRDFIKPCLESIGCKIWFGKAKLKPGKPTCFATFTSNGKRKYIFGLPGNPASAIVTYLLFVRTCLAKLSGMERAPNSEVPVSVGSDVELDERAIFRRVALKWEDGKLVGTGTGGQQSSRILSMRKAEALMHIPARDEHDGDKIQKGAVVKATLISSRISSL